MDIAHLHFLVAEADTAERLATAVMLGHLGAVQITQVPDGHTALRCFQDSFTPAVKVAIIDLALPGMDGLELIRHLAELNCRARLIVVGAQTSNLMFSVETLALAYGVDLLGTICKPVSVAKLQELLENYVPPAPAHAAPKGPTFTFSEVGIGLQARQFEPFFQPKIELETGQVKGLETFARWRHPEHGVLGPSAFIDALEQNNRIDFLDWSMIEKSVERCRYLHDRGLPVSISINLAPENAGHPAFIQQIGACVGRHKVMPDYIYVRDAGSSRDHP